MEVGHITYNYEDVPTVEAFTLSPKRIKCLVGPFGSGKSSGCVMALLRYSAAQTEDHKRVRRTRYAVVRNTVKELKDTTKKTIDEWIMPLRPVWRESENKYILEYALEDGTTVHSEWLLRALDRPDQVKDLLSLELSGAWLNEAREIPKEVFDMIDGRIDRYPRRIADYKCTYPFLILDTNPPDTDNWIYKYFEELVKQDESVALKAEIFKQPSGLSRFAENITNLPTNYYENLAVGKDPDFIKVYIRGEYGYLREGKPVFPMFVHESHVAKKELSPIRGIPIIIGMDFGLFPAAVLAQQMPNGMLHILDEVVSEESRDIGAMITDELLPKLRSRKYFRHGYYVIGDPAGTSRSQLDSRTCYMLLRKHNLRAYPAYTNSLQPRIQAVNQYLTGMVGGRPAFQISPTCPTLIRALAGRYNFRKLRLAGERYTEVPDKGPYSHIADALQYACLGYTPSQANSGVFDDNFDNVETVEDARGANASRPLIMPI